MRDTVQQTLASMAGTCVPAALMHLYYKSFQSMVPGEAFCQVVCLVVTLLWTFVHQPALHADELAARGMVSVQRTFQKPLWGGGGAWTTGVPSLPHQVLD